MVEEHLTRTYDEAKTWLKANDFDKCIQSFEERQFSTDNYKFERAELASMGLPESEVDRFLSLVDCLSPGQSQKLLRKQKQKKMLLLKFTAGDLKQEFVLDPDSLPLVFGNSDAPGDSAEGVVALRGNKICNPHFEVDYDKSQGSIMLRNLNLDPEQSCGLYKRLFENESHNLQPGDFFRIGSLEFSVDRYNVGIMRDIGNRQY